MFGLGGALRACTNLIREVQRHLCRKPSCIVHCIANNIFLVVVNTVISQMFIIIQLYKLALSYKPITHLYTAEM